MLSRPYLQVDWSALRTHDLTPHLSMSTTHRDSRYTVALMVDVRRIMEHKPDLTDSTGADGQTRVQAQGQRHSIS